jgi:pimeloyl-ACP methyl ester carboxylesterase
MAPNRERATAATPPPSGEPPASRLRQGATGGLAIALASAAAVAGLVLQNRADARRVEREHPPRGRFLEAGGVRLHLLDSGEPETAAAAPPKAPVVLLHGNAVDAEDMAASGLFDLLARSGRRVLAFDRPGFGHSDRPRDRSWTAAAQASVFAEAIERLALARPPVVVGHSWGALLALALAFDHPGRVTGLVLVSGYYHPTARADVALFSPPAIPVLGDAFRWTIGPLAGRRVAAAMVRRMFSPAPVPPGFLEAVPVGMMVRPSQIRASAEDAAAMLPSTESFQGRFGELAGLPVAILAGEGDRIVDVGRQAIRLHRALPRSTLRVLHGLGHMLHHGAPLAVVEAVEAVASQSAADPRTVVADAPADAAVPFYP